MAPSQAAVLLIYRYFRSWTKLSRGVDNGQKRGIFNKRNYLIIPYSGGILESTDDAVNGMIISLYRPIGKWGAASHSGLRL